MNERIMMVQSMKDTTTKAKKPSRAALNPAALAEARPCRFCIANWAGATGKLSGTPLVPEAHDCEFTHRDDQRVYDLARAMASVQQQRNPTDEQVAWFLEDADDVVDDFDPAPEKWRIRRLPAQVRDSEDEIAVRWRINGVTYVALEGGKDSRGSVVTLKQFRSWRNDG